MYHPAQDIESREYIELYNAGPTTVTLTGWRLAGAVRYTFPAGNFLSPYSYVVVAKSLAAFHARYPASVAYVVGDYSGQLSNGGEEILLYDENLNLADRVNYGDKGYWPRGADGNGPSLELINPALGNSIAQSWAASVSGGTPGYANSQLDLNPRPFLVQPRHAPAVPRSTNPISIAVHAYDNSAVTSVSLFYKNDSAPSFAVTRMLDDGAHGDGGAGDGVYGVVLPPQAQGSILEFWMRAQDNTLQTRDIPTSAPTANFLLQVDNQDFSATSPTYRVVTKSADHYRLHSRDVQSNELVHATFICGDEIRHNVGIRFRGKGARGATRKSYRIEFSPQEPFRGVENMNLNAGWLRNQALNMDLFQRAGLPASTAQFAYLVFKYNDRNTYYSYDGSPSTEPNLETMGWRVQIEDIGADFLNRAFAGHSNGNLYRGCWPLGETRSADLTYLGTNKEQYRPFYEKHSNVMADDFSDVIQLCNIFTNTPDASFTPTVARYIDADQWMHFWSAMAMVNTDETNIYNSQGDDYFMYFDPAAGPPVAKAVLIPWDFERNLSPTDSIFICSLPKVNRFIRNPDYTPKYFYYIQDMLDHYFTVAIMFPQIDAMAAYRGWEVSPAPGIPPDTMTVNAMKAYVQNRIAYLESVISRDLTVNIVGASRAGDRYLCSQPTVKLNGRAVTAWTRWVKVNGQNARYEYLTGNWGDYVTTLKPGLNSVVVDCVTTAGRTVARKAISVYYGTDVVKWTAYK